MNLEQVRALITVADEDMLPPPWLFLHRSLVHGPAHVGRVMIHALRLIEATGFADEAPRLWASVYLHDIARRHDGVEPGHGRRAWERLASLPQVAELFERGGVAGSDLPAIEAAVTRHSRGEAMIGETHARLIELLKDADGLDRVRIADLDPACLRAPAARTMAGFAERLYLETNHRAPASSGDFAWLWRESRRILGE